MTNAMIIWSVVLAIVIVVLVIVYLKLINRIYTLEICDSARARELLRLQSDVRELKKRS